MTDRPALALVPPHFLAALGELRHVPAEVCVIVDDAEWPSSHDERRLDLALGASAAVIGTHLLTSSGLLAVSLQRLVYVETPAELEALELEHECDTCTGRRRAYVEAFEKHAGPNPGAFVCSFTAAELPAQRYMTGAPAAAQPTAVERVELGTGGYL